MMSQLHQLNLSLLKPHLSLLKPPLSPQSFWFFGYPVPILEMENLEIEENRTVTTWPLAHY
jgi:hypothetical protein